MSRSDGRIWAALVALSLSLYLALQIYGQDSQGTSLNNQLRRAVAIGQVQEVRALLLAGANPNVPLLQAAMWGQSGVFALLIESGAVLIGPDNQGQSALTATIYNSNPTIRKQNSVAQTARRAEGKLVFVDGGGYEEIVKLLLDRGVPTDALDTAGLTPLMNAAMSGNKTIVSLLLEHGAAVDTGSRDGRCTALLFAAWMGHGDIADLLLKAGASPDASDESKINPLLAAACAGSNEATALVMGGKPKSIDSFSGIHGNGYGQVVRALIKGNADLDATGKTGVTPLMAASTAGDVAVVKALLDAGANPNLHEDKGRTALMFASHAGVPMVIEALLSKGADPKAVDEDGKTALTFAQVGKNQDAINLLKHALKIEDGPSPPAR